MLVRGKPLGEPMVWEGPIMLNTREELELAFAEYKRGMSLKHQQPG